MSDEHLVVSLWATVFNGKEKEWLEFIVEFQALLVIKHCVEAIKTIFKTKLPTTEDEALDNSAEARKGMKLARTKNSIAMRYAIQYLHGMAMLNVCNWRLTG